MECQVQSWVRWSSAGLPPGSLKEAVTQAFHIGVLDEGWKSLRRPSSRLDAHHLTRGITDCVSMRGWGHNPLVEFGPAQIFASWATADTIWHGETRAH